MAFPSITYTFTNGSTADATQVNTNFTNLINGLSDTTKDISVNNGTFAPTGTLTASGNVVLGTSTTQTITFNGKVASSIPVSANTSWDFGSATLGMKSVYIGGTSTFTTRIMSAATASWTLTLPTTAGASGQIPQTDGSGNITWNYATYSPSYNFLVNSAFDFWQVGTSATVAATGGGSPAATYLYQADQWYVNNILGGGTVEGIITFSQVTGVTNGSLFGASVKITTAPTGSGIQNGCELYQPLSNMASQQLYNKTASFSVLVKAQGNVNQVGVQFYYATSEAKLSSAIGAEVLTTVSSGSFTACTISGQALGTSQTASGIVGVRIRITAVSSGNTYDLNNGFICEQAQINLGSAIATWSRQYPDPAQELMACQYFYEKSYNPTVALATVTNAGAFYFLAATSAGDFFITYKTTKRTGSGTISTWSPATGAGGSGGSARFRDVTGAADGSLNSIDGQGTGSHAINASTTDGHVFSAHWAADARI